MSERIEGRVKNWFAEKGFGFIRCNTGEDLFVHTSATGFLPLTKGDRVSFEVGTNPRTNKPEAKAVAVMD
jgi:cold shock protein